MARKKSSTTQAAALNLNQMITAALSSIVNGNIWPLEKPVTEDPDEFVVYNPENEYLDYGDNTDLDCETSMQVHLFQRGHANYLSKRKQIRDALRNAGFLIEPSAYVAYETDHGTSANGTGTGWTHTVIVCRMEDN